MTYTDADWTTPGSEGMNLPPHVPSAPYDGPEPDEWAALTVAESDVAADKYAATIYGSAA